MLRHYTYRRFIEETNECQKRTQVNFGNTDYSKIEENMWKLQ